MNLVGIISDRNSLIKRSIPVDVSSIAYSLYKLDLNLALKLLKPSQVKYFKVAFESLFLDIKPSASNAWNVE